MPDQGKLQFRTSLHQELPKLTHHQGVSPRLPAVCLAVQDNGSEGDVINLAEEAELLSCDVLVPELPDFLSFGFPLTHGNINVNP